ncbi:MAG: HINT domain-containing protein, partial [Candidatus Hydrogenedentes bacterium]|nr:HINT domain-containing protein [Candidatus Hydrogenedentota bacterium]
PSDLLACAPEDAEEGLVDEWLGALLSLLWLKPRMPLSSASRSGGREERLLAGVLRSTGAGGGGGGGGGKPDDLPLCFVAGTLVLTDDGMVPIEEIEVGDKVWSYNEETDTVELSEVTRLYRDQAERLVLLRTGDTLIETTAEHPFWVVDTGWTSAEDLHVGDQLLTKERQAITIESTELVDRIVPVYNLEVAKLHTYFVGEQSVLVHNACKGDSVIQEVSLPKIRTAFVATV